ncbi:MAG TPA: LysM peptidoglycan-binding domain-containing protein [Anaerolineales bacterium]
MRRFLACLFLISTLTACAGNAEAVTDLAPAVPYQTITPSKTPTVIPPLTGIILPTPTTFTYTVVQGDTLNGIAGRYGVTLEALLAANPGLQPAALSVGTTLIIPTGSETPGEPVPTSAPLPALQARCWSEMDGGLWCFALVQNEYPETLENLSARFTLLDANGQELAGQVAFALLNTLPSGQSLPLAVHFPPPLQVNVSVQVQVLTAIRLLPGDTRYLPVMPENTLVSVDASGRTAQVTGRVILTGASTANTLWVLATAYDTAGNVVGVRRWESPSALTADAPVSFDFLVSSVGPEIDRVEFLAEARP